MRTGGTVGNDMSHQHCSVLTSTSVAGTCKTWPSETELVLTLRKKVNLTSQHVVIHVLLQDAIDSVQLSLLFDNAFPDANTTLQIVQDHLFSAAEKYKPGTVVILKRLTSDNEHLTKMSSVVRLIFSNRHITEAIYSYMATSH